MTRSTLSLRPADPADIKAIRRIEADPRYDGLVGRWTAERHAEEMVLPSSLYFVLRDEGGDIVGFALLQGFGDNDRKLHLKRIAVSEPGQGLGSRLLGAVLERLYETTDTNRVDLDVFLGNDRARRAYEKAGFKVEGVLRDYHCDGDGRFRSMWLMSVLRADWMAQRPKILPTLKV